MNPEEIGLEIQRARSQMDPKVTQAEMAAALSMSPATISLIENGQAADIGLRRLTRVLEYVGLEISIRPARMGYTLDDAKEDLRQGADRPRMRG